MMTLHLVNTPLEHSTHLIYYRCTDRQTDRQVDRQTGRQTDRHR